jgi:arabinose-5-phosphate isomerase
MAKRQAHFDDSPHAAEALGKTLGETLEKTLKDDEPGPGETDLESACHVLETEARAINALAATLDSRFIDILDIFAKCTGRIIVTGMGKSGHVANKIAATMASTGTPAQFVHPGEASHGDLGMITRDDAVLVLSNSGETVELNDISAYARRFCVPLVVITSGRESSLAKAADIALIMPEFEEACSMGLAPTTSTTVMLALGDALAVALLNRQGFSAEKFHVFHPQGRLGAKLVRVEDLMHHGDEIPLLESGAPMSEALLAMTNKRFGCIGMVDTEGLLIGIITDGDLRRHMGGNLLSQTTDEVMTANPKTIRPHALAAEALNIMNNGRITSLFVVEDGPPVGIIHVHDCLRAGIV